MARTALLVDLDGTLWHSAAWYPKLIAEATGHDAAHVARALQRTPVARGLASFRVSRSRFAKLSGELVETLTVYDGVAETLVRLGRRGVPAAAVTNLPAWVAGPMLSATKLAPLFGSVVDWGRTTRHKPRPDPILAALADLGVKPTRRSWYVGDSGSDGQAAAAGVSFAWAGYSTDQPAPAVAAVTLATFADVAGLFG